MPWLTLALLSCFTLIVSPARADVTDLTFNAVFDPTNPDRAPAADGSEDLNRGSNAQGLNGGANAPAQLNRTPIESTQSSQDLTGQVQNFNQAGSNLSGGRLMDLAARLQMQSQVDQLAQKYNDLQKDVRSGQYDTTKIGAELSRLGKSVTEIKLPSKEKTAEFTSVVPDKTESKASGNVSAGAQPAGASPQALGNPVSFDEKRTFPSGESFPAKGPTANEQIVSATAIASSGSDAQKISVNRPTPDGGAKGYYEQRLSGSERRTPASVTNSEKNGESGKSVTEAMEEARRRAVQAPLYADREGAPGHLANRNRRSELEQMLKDKNGNQKKSVPALAPARKFPLNLLDVFVSALEESANSSEQPAFFAEFKRSLATSSFFRALDFPKVSLDQDEGASDDAAVWLWAAIAFSFVSAFGFVAYLRRRYHASLSDADNTPLAE